MSIETPNLHRLSPSGMFLPRDFGGTSIIRNVYKGYFDSGALDGSGILIPTAAESLVETFNITLPLLWPNTDPPETFDPNKLLYLIWARVVAHNDYQGATPGPASLLVNLEVDAAGGRTTIENIVRDEVLPQAFSNAAGTFRGRSFVHQIPDEGVLRVDGVDMTVLAVFRPGTIPNWTTGNATPWVAGDTRHIYVTVQALGGAETGDLFMQHHESNIMIVELYGDVVETIGTSSAIQAPV